VGPSEKRGPGRRNVAPSEKRGPGRRNVAPSDKRGAGSEKRDADDATNASSSQHFNDSKWLCVLAWLCAGMAIVLLLGLVVLAAWYLWRPQLKRKGKPLRYVAAASEMLTDISRRAPDSLPLLGHGLHFLRSRRTLLAWFEKCELLFGRETFAITVPSLPPGVVINDPDSLDFVFRHESIFRKGAFFTGRSRDLFGASVCR
jgi:hypothetical protein